MSENKKRDGASVLERVKASFERLGRSSVAAAALMIVFGLILVIWPGTALRVIVQILGVALLLGAATALLSWYSDRKRKSDQPQMLAVAAVLAIVGLILVVRPLWIVNIFPVAAGILVIFAGLANLSKALDQKNWGFSRWPVSMLLSVLMIVLGVVIILKPSFLVNIEIILIGVACIYEGVSSLWIMSRK